MELLTKNYYWPNLDNWVRTYVKTCDAYQRNKTARHKKYGRLQPLEVPTVHGNIYLWTLYLIYQRLMVMVRSRL